MPIKILEVKDLSVKYNGISALSDVSFEAEAGDYIGIVGHNGSGKTTLVKALLGLLPFDGNVFFQGKNLREFTASKHIGYLPQKMAFFDQRFPATALEIVATGVYCCKKTPKHLLGSDYAAAENIMETLGIKELKDRPIGKLSGGEQQRVLLARTMVHSPAILILDEPTVALDPASREIFYAMVEKLNKEKQVTILMVSHDVVSIGGYTTKILYLDGKVLFLGTYGEFCDSNTVSSYLGDKRRFNCCGH
ncbi:MAG TPA: ABC transporter ATP-binding protein [Candidatus Omnitrophota bacterium]|nr:ABC transporter ATP-binding protein [Candidatus Omnitrophota bacterium]HPS20989.1 ABC transporter ATP-binding protein [Candidatus Omnitrophota bacterium]